ncbi:uncharacterized protein PODANS_5_10565 [Podospora anserina S mat+]|uniref:Podospora anserina S mat+ genomic DNA chromosome 5, supercontig 10 n=1 Tax=Podospora anserina (strain S / ATCC MYA-4624 / DSM 980 / FGSC 10383) TaxID=515849 RepID=B2APC6_PODAN|nr:uncharacterized protein PODANS_5_10565 [Podospora anserina S mat+]CAP65843.1 unnamed protein product [Podospora anserina S mat+]CDP30295.1 Putative protein of unknown function [Podospora anserina S mat+]
MVSAKYLLLAPTSCLTVTANGSVWWHTCGLVSSYSMTSSRMPLLTVFLATASVPTLALTRVSVVPAPASGSTAPSARSGSPTSAPSRPLAASSLTTSCQDQRQSVGSSGTYACTAFNQNSGSMRCYYNV